MFLWGVSIPASNGALSQQVVNPHVGRGPEGLPGSGDPSDPTLRVIQILNLTPAAQPHQIVALLLTLVAETMAAAPS